jgi:hypothetical protein
VTNCPRLKMAINLIKMMSRKIITLLVQICSMLNLNQLINNRLIKTLP